MTVKLYYLDQRLDNFTSEVEKVIQKNDEYHIVLKETAFYPEGGGQPSDKGFIENVKVEYVYEDNNKIYHVTKSPIYHNVVQGTINFERRFDYMQQHSGEHLLAAAFYKLFNGHNIGFHLGEEYVTIDISLPDVTKQMIEEVEVYVNNLINNNIPINAYTVNEIQLKGIPLRKKTNVKNEIRIVEIDGVDYSACCGTHLNSTGQIGFIKILRVEKYKGNTRVYFICGKRAVNDYYKKHDIIINLTRALSCEVNEINMRIQKQYNIIQEQQKSIIELKQKVIEYEVNDIISNLHSDIFIKIYENKPYETICEISNRLNKRGISTFLCTKLEKSFVLSTPLNKDIDCEVLIKEKLKEYNGKGGGKRNRVQGKFNQCEQLLSFFNHIKTLI